MNFETSKKYFLSLIAGWGVLLYLIWFVNGVQVYVSGFEAVSIEGVRKPVYIFVCLFLVYGIIFRESPFDNLYSLLARCTKRINSKHIFVFSVLLCVTFIYIKVLKVNSLHEDDFDLGIYSNLAYNISQGRGFLSSVLGHSHLGEHFSPIMLFVAPMYWIFPSAYTLCVVMSVIHALAVWLLYKLSKEMLGDDEKSNLISIVLCLLLLAYKPFINSLYYGFHPSAFAIPLLFAIFLMMKKKKWAVVYVLMFFLFLTKELALLAFVSIALYCFFYLKEYKRGAVIIALTAVLAGVVFKLVIPYFAGAEGWSHYGRLSTIQNIFADKKLKLFYLFLLFAPFAFIHVLSPRAFLIALPLIVINLLVSYRPQYSVDFQYDDMVTPILFMGVLETVCLWRDKDIKGIRRHAYLMLPIAVFAVSILMAGQSPMNAYSEYKPEELHDEIREALKPYIAMPDDQAIISDSYIGPFVCHRERHQPLRWGNFLSYPFKKDDIILLVPGWPQVDIVKAELFLSRALEGKCVELLRKDDVLWAYKVLDADGMKEIEIYDLVSWQFLKNSYASGDELVLEGKADDIAVMMTEISLKPDMVLWITFRVDVDADTGMHCDLYNPQAGYDLPECEVGFNFYPFNKTIEGKINAGPNPPDNAYLRFYTTLPGEIRLSDIKVSKQK